MPLQATTMQPGQYVQLTKLPPPDAATGETVPGLRVGSPGVVRGVGHDIHGQALVLVQFWNGQVWCACDSVKAVRVALKVPDELKADE